MGGVLDRTARCSIDHRGGPSCPGGLILAGPGRFSVSGPVFGCDLANAWEDSDPGNSQHVPPAVSLYPTMPSLLLWSVLGASVAVLFASLFEWAVHRWLMHRPLLGISYAFRAHALNHHKKFKADHTYHLVHGPDKKDIPMAWWNGPVLILMCLVPFVLTSWATGHWMFTLAALPVFVGYYVAYEYLHWCMHLPKSRRVEKSELFRRLNGHHLLHHRYMNRNYNVVLPLVDLLTGTLLPRSKTHFAQARGPSVPDVQPTGVPAGV